MATSAGAAAAPASRLRGGRARDQPAVVVRKGPWTLEEDLILVSYISQHGEGSWDNLARAAGLSRNGKSCRLRWLNYLRPGVRRGSITAGEDTVIRELQARWGNKWSKISKHLPGRTDNEIKNYWRTRIQIKRPAAHKTTTTTTTTTTQQHHKPSSAVSSDEGASSAAAADATGGDYFWWTDTQPERDSDQMAAVVVADSEGASLSALTTSNCSTTGGDWQHVQQTSYPCCSELRSSAGAGGHVETTVGLDALLTTHFSSSPFSDSFWNVVDNFWETKPVTGAF
ncbi:hypothetical protein U9M48_018307 [Paspalum notatum var. saurae]|uniref:Uncharacterized protein n=1 Tax=Paspalum notatum var. saurae TaxID=547442 RepID=A0AAQ3WQ70_PASNO